MWLFFEKSFLSIDQEIGEPGFMHVRARVPGDIEAVFPYAVVRHTPTYDYAYRATVRRWDVMEAIGKHIAAHTSPDFKNDLDHAHGRPAVYMQVWGVMADWQRRVSAAAAVEAAVIPGEFEDPFDIPPNRPIGGFRSYASRGETWPDSYMFEDDRPE